MPSAQDDECAVGDEACALNALQLKGRRLRLSRSRKEEIQKGFWFANTLDEVLGSRAQVKREGGED